ncbi:MAG: hypothetical protein JWO14_1568 [Solirubrobacterales bacterium]|nr:hypothetical protein [Solirubrobacterales bacterium]
MARRPIPFEGSKLTGDPHGGVALGAHRPFRFRVGELFGLGLGFAAAVQLVATEYPPKAFMPTDNESCEVGAVGGLRFSAAGRNRDDDSRSS